AVIACIRGASYGWCSSQWPSRSQPALTRRKQQARQKVFLDAILAAPAAQFAVPRGHLVSKLNSYGSTRPSPGNAEVGRPWQVDHANLALWLSLLREARDRGMTVVDLFCDTQGYSGLSHDPTDQWDRADQGRDFGRGDR
ncbi:MAG TPA: hypothetical protein VL119_10605, partial [Acidimicrobiia bacterium]|nr:hypothetical protein [Acidimicrobiia bacterium]